MISEGFTDILNALPESAMLISGEGQILSVNTSLAQMLGRHRGHLVGTALAEIVASDAARLSEYLDRCAGSRQVVLGALSLRSQNGQVADYRCEGSMVRPWSEQEAALILLRLKTRQAASNRFVILNRQIEELTHEIRERRKVEADRERLLQREQALRSLAEQSGRMKDEFLATLSHELRTPLNHMYGWIRMLLAGGLPQEVSARALEIIDQNIEAQIRLVEDLLDVSQMMTGNLRLSIRQADPVQIINAAVLSAGAAAEAKNIDLQTDFGDWQGTIACDSDRLQQIVWNLLSNAIKFTGRGGQVGISLAYSDSQLSISVSDTGEGISDEFLPFVFDRFRQADASTTRQVGGLGLGLSLVRDLTELHGGTVKASSEGVGQGAVFTVTLPVQQTAPVKPPLSTDANLMQSEESGGGSGFSATALSGVSILVVDDEEETRQLLAAFLNRCGALVHTASSVAEAFEYLETPPDEKPPDLLISDVAMPETDGYTLLRQLRTREAGLGLSPASGLPAIALTSRSDTEERVRALEAGFQIHVSKPIDLSELMVVVISLLSRRKTITEPRSLV